MTTLLLTAALLIGQHTTHHGTTAPPPKVPGGIPEAAAWKAAIAIWDYRACGDWSGSPRDRARAEARSAARFEATIGARTGLAPGQIRWVAANLCTREVLCAGLGLRTGPGEDTAGALRPGPARVTLYDCGCGMACGAVDVVDGPESMRMVEDTLPDPGPGHSGAQHDRELGAPRYARGRWAHALDRFEVLEIIAPGRHRNRLIWARCRTQSGRVAYVRADGLKNTTY